MVPLWQKNSTGDVNEFIWRSLNLSIHQPICPSIQPSIHSSNHLSTHLSIHSSISPSIYLSTHPPTHPSFHPSIHPSIHPSRLCFLWARGCFRGRWAWVSQQSLSTETALLGGALGARGHAQGVQKWEAECVLGKHHWRTLPMPGDRE
jgi:hypothetical protein